MHRITLPTLIALLLLAALTGCNLSGGDGEAPITIPPATDPPTEAGPTIDPSTQIAPTAFVQPTPLPIPGQPTVASGPALVLPPTAVIAAPDVQPITAEQSAYRLVADTGISGQGFDLLDVRIDHYAQNPADGNQYAVIDSAGLLYISGAGGTNAFRVEQGPYTQFPAPTRDENNAAADLAVWSPNGQYVAFVVNGDQQAADGVWYFQPGIFAPLQLLVDCPSFGFIGCNIVRPVDTFMLWESRELHWSPNSEMLLINVDLPTENRRGLLIKPITREERTRDSRPPVLLYEYGSWGADGRILVSGRDPDGAIMVAWLNADGSRDETVFNAGANGLWMGWAVETPDGEIVALGRPQNMDGPVAVYDGAGNPLSAPVGVAFPERVVWSPDRSAVLIETAGRQYVVETNGQITDISDDTGRRAVNWVR